jgi:hypothetical protein
LDIFYDNFKMSHIFYLHFKFCTRYFKEIPNIRACIVHLKLNINQTILLKISSGYIAEVRKVAKLFFELHLVLFESI